MFSKKGAFLPELRPKMRDGSGTVELYPQLPSLPKSTRLFSVIRLVPGASIGYHVHQNETEFFYILSGSGMASDNGRLVRLSEGDTMATPSGCGHAIENDGDVDLTLLAVIVLDS